MHLQTAFRDSFVGLRPPQNDKAVIPSEPPVIPSEAKESLCPVATSLCDRVLSLPMHPYLTLDEIDIVCAAIRHTLVR